MNKYDFGAFMSAQNTILLFRVSCYVCSIYSLTIVSVYSLSHMCCPIETRAIKEIILAVRQAVTT